ncbi:MAG: FAD-dependent oxidoreductase [Deltaproteobacteria bacterium]|nr:FAD-dependent oxidoreductase [Deltaproteobacteria bacterium]
MIGILGAGVSGLSLSCFLRSEHEVIEASKHPGGLCRTYWEKGFGFDVGGHILFSKHSHVNQFVEEALAGNLRTVRRENRVLFRDRLVKYPFENDLAALPVEDRYECLMGYLRAPGGAASNLEEWCRVTFGDGISDRYLVPYNEKIWKRPAREIGTAWVERIPKPPLEDVVRSALGIATEGHTHQLYFRYPEGGGFEALTQAIRARARGPVLTGLPVTSIRRDGAGFAVTCGEERRSYEELVVTFSMHEAARAIGSVPSEVEAALASLGHNVLRVVCVGLSHDRVPRLSAIYVPDPSVLAHRICFPAFFSPSMAPEGRSSLLAEITCRPGSELDQVPDGELVDRVIRDLERLGLASSRDVVMSKTLRFERAYPVYDLDYVRNVTLARDWFGSLGIHLLGRFAEFDYINSDECIHRAMALARLLG